MLSKLDSEFNNIDYILCGKKKLIVLMEEKFEEQIENKTQSDLQF
jgi:hypothetical protein